MADFFVPTERLQMNTDEMPMRRAMTLLFGDIDRQGPGDDAFTKKMLNRLPVIPENSRIADMGCGTGAGSLLLAQHYRQPVLCVDTSQEFLETLNAKAYQLELNTLIRTLQGDMGKMDPNEHQFDLLWSEGAAYNLTFDFAMQKWRPLMVREGIAVVSELSWFGSERPQKVLDFWDKAYPELASETDNKASAAKHGFEVLFTERLPSPSWWKSYYDPLLAKAEVLSRGAPEKLQEAINEVRWEIDVFREFSDHFGYTFYGLRAV
jgi:SAM-dependent methyltransferase